MAELTDFKRQEKSRQQQALLSLKANSEEAYSKMAANNERNRKKAAKEDAVWQPKSSSCFARRNDCHGKCRGSHRGSARENQIN